MKKFFLEAKYLLGFFFAFTAVTVFSIAETEPENGVLASPADLIKSNLSVSEVLHHEGTRRPASISEIKNEILDINVLCDDLTQKTQKSSAQQLVMLNLNVCVEIKSAKSISLTNITNGFKAQIFKMGAKTYRTDFIQLSRGTNILVLESVLKDGQKRVQTLEILSGS